MEGHAKGGSRIRHNRKRILTGHPNPANPFPISVILGIVPTNPLRFPVRAQEKAHLPPGSFPRFRSLPGRIPYPDFPVVSLARFQSRTPICNSDGLIRIHFAAIPDVRLSGPQTLAAAGYQNLVSRLHPVALAAVALPRQVRGGGVDPQRILQVFAA